MFALFTALPLVVTARSFATAVAAGRALVTLFPASFRFTLSVGGKCIHATSGFAVTVRIATSVVSPALVGPAFFGSPIHMITLATDTL